MSEVADDDPNCLSSSYRDVNTGECLLLEYSLSSFASSPVPGPARFHIDDKWQVQGAGRSQELFKGPKNSQGRNRLRASRSPAIMSGMYYIALSPLIRFTVASSKTFVEKLSGPAFGVERDAGCLDFSKRTQWRGQRS